MGDMAEKGIMLVIIVALSYMALSYVVTGSPFSGPSDLFNKATKPTYQASFVINRGLLPGGALKIQLKDFEVERRKLSIASKSLGIIGCVGGKFKGTTTVKVTKPTGEKVTIVNDPNLGLCKGDKKLYNDKTFTYTEGGEYEFEISVINNRNGNLAFHKTITKTLEVR